MKACYGNFAQHTHNGPYCLVSIIGRLLFRCIIIPYSSHCSRFGLIRPRYGLITTNVSFLRYLNTNMQPTVCIPAAYTLTLPSCSVSSLLVVWPLCPTFHVFSSLGFLIYYVRATARPGTHLRFRSEYQEDISVFHRISTNESALRNDFIINFSYQRQRESIP